MKNWEFEELYYANDHGILNKTGVGRLTVVNSRFKNISFYVNEGTIVDKGMEWDNRGRASDRRFYNIGLFMFASATLEVSVGIGDKQTVSYNIEGNGKMVKKGGGDAGHVWNIHL